MLKKIVCIPLLTIYIAFVYWITVFDRASYPQADSDWRPFWTYGEIADGRDELIGEVIANVLMFIPIGLLVGLLIKRREWLLALIIGVGLSSGIELLQLNLKRGLCETDDIIHNTVGCLMGFALIKLFCAICSKQSIIKDI